MADQKYSGSTVIFKIKPTKSEEKEKLIFLIGDAILDNFYWLNNKHQDLKYQLECFKFKVSNWAVDETRISDIHQGIVPNHIYQTSRSYPYTTDVEGKLSPLKLLTHTLHPFSSVYDIIPKKDKYMVVISVGGNNIRAKLMNVVGGINYLINSVLTKEFQKDYERMITDVQRHVTKIVLVSIYLPYMGNGSIYSKFASSSHMLTTRWHNFLNEIGKKYDIPVLDLSRTLNPFDRSHYSESSDTHMSDFSNKCLAQCLNYIYDNYQGHRIYYAPQCDFKNIITIFNSN